MLEEVAELVMPLIPAKKRAVVASDLIDIFEQEDCDTIGECEQKDIRAEYDRRFPPDKE